jgi:hypothetical protein
MIGYAERRVLALLLEDPAKMALAGLDSIDFEYTWHSIIFDQLRKGNDVNAMTCHDDVKQYVVGLDENWTPENFGTFVTMVHDHAEQRRFEDGLMRLR